MQVEGGRDQAVGADHLPQRSGKVTLRIAHPDDAHRAVDVEQQPVERPLRGGQLQDAGLDVLVGLWANRAARQGPAVVQRHPVDDLPKFPASFEERVVGQQFVTLAAGECLVAAQVRGEGAGLNGHAGDGDPRPGNPPVGGGRQGRAPDIGGCGHDMVSFRSRARAAAPRAGLARVAR